jgi:hypothetical protein
MEVAVERLAFRRWRCQLWDHVEGERVLEVDVGAAKNVEHHLGADVKDLGEVPRAMLSKKALRERRVRYDAGVRQANLFETRLIEKLPVVMGRILEITEQESSEHRKWASSLWKDEACRPFVDESLGWNEDCFKAFVKMLAGRVSGLSKVVGVYRDHHPPYRELVQRIEATDRLIDLIVYRLYGLTEEEVAVVEGRRAWGQRAVRPPRPTPCPERRSLGRRHEEQTTKGDPHENSTAARRD